MDDSALGLWGVPLAILAGAIRVSTPFIFVSLGETLTERSGRINLGLEGTLVFGAMAAYAVAVMTGSPWAGVAAAMVAGSLFGLLHGFICKFPKVNDIAIGIAMMQFGLGLAFFFGKPFIQPVAPKLPVISLGFWSHLPQIQAALTINILFVIGLVLALVLWWALKNTRIGLILRVVGDSSDAARAMGINPDTVRLLATMAGGALAAVGGAYLSLFYPGSWNERISSGQGLMAVALVIFARWNPLGCVLASLLFGGAGALGPALQSVGVSEGYYLFYAAPYVLTLIILIITSSPTRALSGAPAALSLTK
ncbi:ABC transporter permease [Agrobacterium vitis]|uniref:ABC transporter membrane spanning protein (Sugar) n=2 Tax=Rhizobium/Agrobacterium group TaxID=227290 RepID=B9K1J5_ALLAM|nr:MULTISPECIES: ABC transporter permease [Rhizobium/Agrobacterium group]ACM38743.1 ABC transporter membrane spanning protein (sugar) [Allorhizobium ampelinum S4]KAA3518595.1 ABC transporter permease [Agrobacterium vitis]KAA3530191.1 ABC transporter permease [Agrobacterium vitis]MCE6075630.1 ABC transporter permease [Agrobacterium vitis]MCF1445911.1 ABC transporter permease [Allorhizobium ampelinum]